MTDLGRVLDRGSGAEPHARSPLSMASAASTTRRGSTPWRASPPASARLGLAPGDRLAVIMQNRWEMAALHWACQLAGIIVVPLNWRSNAERAGLLPRGFGGWGSRLRRVRRSLPWRAPPVRREPPPHRRVGESLRRAARSISPSMLMAAVGTGHAARQARTTSRSFSTLRAPPGAARACRARTAPNALRLSPTSRRTATAWASAPSASCRSTTPWACARCSRWRRWAAPSSASTASTADERAPADRGRTAHLRSTWCPLSISTCWGARASPVPTSPRCASWGSPGAPMAEGLLRRVEDTLSGPSSSSITTARRRSTPSPSNRMRGRQAGLGRQGRHQPAHPRGGDRRGRSRVHRRSRRRKAR